MSLISLTYIFSTGATIIASQHNTNNSTIYNDYNGNITDSNISANAAIEYTKLSLNNTIRATDILSTTIFNVSNIPALALPYIKCSNSQPQNTAGGTATNGSWQTYPLNTKDLDTANIATLSSNQIILPSGTYQFYSSIPFYTSGANQTRLYNVTASSILLNGSNNGTTLTGGIEPSSVIMGQFILSITSTISVQYQVTSSTSINGLGLQCNFGIEVYGVVEFTKVA